MLMTEMASGKAESTDYLRHKCVAPLTLSTCSDSGDREHSMMYSTRLIIREVLLRNKGGT